MKTESSGIKRITFRADEDAIALAHKTARAQHTTLNAAFRSWLADFVAQSAAKKAKP